MQGGRRIAIRQVAILGHDGDCHISYRQVDHAGRAFTPPRAIRFRPFYLTRRADGLFDARRLHFHQQTKCAEVRQSLDTYFDELSRAPARKLPASLQHGTPSLRAVIRGVIRLSMTFAFRALAMLAPLGAAAER